MKIQPTTIATLAVLGVATLAVVYFAKKGPAQAVAEWSLDLGAMAGTAVVNAAAGGVIAVGQAVGIPRTNMTECEKAKAEGRTWDASFACPASTFLSYLWN